MLIPRDEFRDLVRNLVRAFLEEEHPDCASVVDFIGKLSRQLGELLEEHDATNEEYRIVVGLLLDPFLSNRDLSPDTKHELLRACEDGFGVEIRRTH